MSDCVFLNARGQAQKIERGELTRIKTRVGARISTAAIGVRR